MASNLSPLIAPCAVAGSAGGFALVESGGFTGFGPKPRPVASRAGNGPEAAAFWAFLPSGKQVFRLTGRIFVGGTERKVETMRKGRGARHGPARS